MSGIAGIFHRDGGSEAGETIPPMLAAMAHRGPDGVGHWIQGAVGLGHLQFCTTPESLREKQPLVSADGNYVLVCDGRVDNREELLTKLQSQARLSREATDAELILQAYRVWGEGCAQQIVGDFAFVIWDGVKQQLFGARDPLGIRTFYYYQDARRFVFASDVQAVLAGAGLAPQINELRVAQYLLGRLNEAEQSFFQGILQILPAQCLVVTRQETKKQAYWEPNPWEQLRYRDAGEYAEHFRQLFTESIKSRLRSISPVGISLSGGLDSTSVACVAANALKEGLGSPNQLRPFSFVFKNIPTADEKELIQLVAQSLGTPPNYIYADDLWGFKPLQNSEIHWNQPYPVPFQARHEVLLSQARDSGVKVMFTGEGGDELFDPGFSYLLDLFRGLRWGRLYKEWRRLKPSSRTHFHKLAFWLLVPHGAQQAYGRLRGRKTPVWLNAEFIEASGALAPVPAPARRRSSLYCRMQHTGIINLARVPFLSYATEMHFYHHIEIRHPFLDRRLVDFLSRVPPHIKFADGWSKLLLRQAMQGILPDPVRLRVGKAHFTDLITRGIYEERDWIEARIDRGCLVSQGWLNRAELKAAYESYREGSKFLATQLLEFITLESWLGHYLGSNSGGVPVRIPAGLATIKQERR